MLAVALAVLALLRIALPTRILLLLTRTRPATLLLLAGLLTRGRILLVLIRHLISPLAVCISRQDNADHAFPVAGTTFPARDLYGAFARRSDVAELFNCDHRPQGRRS